MDHDFNVYDPAVQSILGRYTGGYRGRMDYDTAVNALNLPNACRDDPALAAATVILMGVQTRLPQWACFDGDEVHLSRLAHKVSQGQIGLASTLVCAVNWASTGPGYSWPLTYYLTYLPTYDVEILTASTDSHELFGGACDVALACVKPQPNRRHLAIQLLSDIWDDQIMTYQSEWEDVIVGGLIDRLTAYQILRSRRKQNHKGTIPTPHAVGDEVIKVFARDELQGLSKVLIASLAEMVRLRLSSNPKPLDEVEQDRLRRLVFDEASLPQGASILNIHGGAQ